MARTRSNVVAIVILLLTVSFAGSAAAQVEPPPPPPPVVWNDDFANAAPLSGFGTLQTSTDGATLEPGEPRPCGSIGSTLWFAWVASTTGDVVFHTLGSSYDTVLAVYSGSSLETLDALRCNDDIEGGLSSRVGFHALANATYYVQLGGFGGGQGVANMTIEVGYRDPRVADPTTATDVGVNAQSGMLWPEGYILRSGESYDLTFYNVASPSVYNTTEVLFFDSTGAPRASATMYPEGCGSGASLSCNVTFANHPLCGGYWQLRSSGSDMHISGISVSGEPCQGDDADGDGHFTPMDCDDADAGVNPAAYDTPLDGIDQDCDHVDDEPAAWIGGFSPSSGPVGTIVTVYGSNFTYVDSVSLGGWYATSSILDDGALTFEVPAVDFHGDLAISVYWQGGAAGTCCFRVTDDATDADADGWTSDNDCDDNAAWIHPGAYDTPNNGVDEDCDGADAYDPCAYPYTCPVDNDADGYDTSSDCDDADARVHPGAWDSVGDGVDQDCDGVDGSAIRYLDAYMYVYHAANWSSDHVDFGVQEGATDGFDNGYDAIEPPAPPAGPYVRGFFHYPGNAPGYQELSESILAPTTEARYLLRYEWSGMTGSNGTGILEWFPDRFANLPEGYSVLLLDGDQVVDMRDEAAYPWVMYSFEAPGVSGSRDFEILVSRATTYNMSLRSGWNLVSVPVAPFNASVASVFGSDVDAVYTWDGSSYVAVESVEPGVGYWVHLALHEYQWRTIRLYGTPVLDLTLELDAGWNLVGAPFDGGRLPTDGSVSPQNWAWYGQGYGPAYGYLEPGRGSWVFAHADDISVPISATFRLEALELVEPADVTAGEFTLPFLVAGPGSVADGATLQSRTDASDGYDRGTDVVEAPRSPAASWVQAFLTADGLQLDASSIAVASETTQRLRVERAGEAGEVVLSWEGATLPDGFVFELVDGARRVDMRAETSYAWTAPSGASAREMLVVMRPVDAPVCLVEIDGACLAALPFDPAARLARFLG